MSSSSDLDPFPYGVDFTILDDGSIGGEKLVDDDSGEAFDLPSAFDAFLKQSKAAGRKETYEFFHGFVSAAIFALELFCFYDFFHFDIDDDDGPTFNAKISTELETIKRRLVNSIRQSIRQQTKEPVSSHLVDKLLDDSGVRLLLNSVNAESLLAQSFDLKKFAHRRREYSGLLEGAYSDDFETFDLRLAKYQVRQRGLAIRDNAALISRLQEDIRARIKAFDTPTEVYGQGPGISGYFAPGISHGGGKAHLDRHKSKGSKSSSARIWKHITISRDETSASDFLRERILIFFLKNPFRARQHRETEENNLRQIEGLKSVQQEHQLHSFTAHPRRESFVGEALSPQTPHQEVTLQRSPATMSRSDVQIKEMDLNKQEGTSVPIEGYDNGSKVLSLGNSQDRQFVDGATFLDPGTATLEAGRGTFGNCKIIHLLPHSGSRTTPAYLDKPAWAPGFGRDSFHLKAYLPISNVQEYVQQSGFDFTIGRFYSESSLMPALRRELAKKQPPPDPIHFHEQITLHSQPMIQALQEYLTYHPDFVKNFPQFNVRAPIRAPYTFWYTCRSRAAFQQLGYPHQDLMRTLTSWIDTNYNEKYSEAKRHFENGVVTLGTMPFLLCPGDVLVWKKKGKTQAAMTSSEVIQRSPPILYWDSSQMSEVGAINSDGSKRGEFSTTWSVDIWSYRFNGEFHRDKRSTEIKFKASSLEQEVDISKLGVYPLRFAGENTRLQLETRGKTFWTCRHRNLVSHTGGEGVFAVSGSSVAKIYSQLTAMVKNGERFMVDFQVYKQLHNDSLKFKLLYEEDDDSRGEIGDSGDGDGCEDGESRLKISVEDMASETPPSQPYIYLFPDTVPGYNLRSKKWGKFCENDARYHESTLKVI